jgi:hypothetical protein
MVDENAVPLTIFLSYPNTISPVNTAGCTVTAAKNLDGSETKPFSGEC